MRHLLVSAISFVFLFATQAYAKKEPTFDVFAMPTGVLDVGSYEMNEGNFDEGKFAALMVGGRAGIKLGPIYLGGTYLEGSPSSESDKSLDVNERVRYPLLDGGRLQSIGATVGVGMGRVYLWATYFLVEELSQDTTVLGTDFEHTYHGTGLGVNLSVNVWDYVHVGAFYHSRSFDKYSSDHPSDSADKADLTNSVDVSSYGISLSYLVPFSRVGEFID